MKNYKEETSKLGEFLLNPLNRILAAGRLGYSNIKNRGFSINWLRRILATTGLGRLKTEPKDKA